jgi:competence protein ComEC
VTPLVFALMVATIAVATAGDPWRWRIALVVVLVGLLAGERSRSEWAALAPGELGPFSGWGRVVGDPQPVRTAVRVVLELDGQRFEYWARSRAKQSRVESWHAGDWVMLSGRRNALESDRQMRVAWQHVVGQFDLEWAADVRSGTLLDRSSNAVRHRLAVAATQFPGDDGALYRGLVVGDDGDQPQAMLDRFRASGLSHLTAVSGQNVAFVLAAAAPALRRLRPWSRWVASVALIVWFAGLCRFEPSILRAGTMAGLSATAFVMGRERAPARLLWLAVIGLLLIDPLLSRSIGFWLSVGATAGVAIVGPVLARWLTPLGPLAAPVGVTLGAQVGVVGPAMLVFGTVPLVSIPANLLAVPVAGAVMLYGLPAGLLSGAVPPLAPVLMFPCRLGVRWVDLVAAMGQRLEPGGRATLIGWTIMTVALGLIAVRQAFAVRIES